MTDLREDSVGKAYGFFYCGATKQEIETELPLIRNLVWTPSKLELSLIEGMDNVKGDETIIALSKEAKQNGINYMLQGTYSNATNEETAEEITGILNQLYLTNLYRPKEQFGGLTFYEEKGEYMYKD